MRKTLIIKLILSVGVLQCVAAIALTVVYSIIDPSFWGHKRIAVTILVYWFGLYVLPLLIIFIKGYINWLKKEVW